MKSKNKGKIKKYLKTLWWFIWEDDSFASWIVNIVIAFILVKFLIYPALGFMLGTSLPVVAVVSGSMEHNGLGFDDWWIENGEWYLQKNIDKEEMKSFAMHNGFNKGDIIVLVGEEPENIEIGDIIVYSTERYKYPIIHRVVKSWTENDNKYLTTKGDNNYNSDPLNINQNQVVGKTLFKIPWLGWIKLLFTKMIGG
ncbi:MAG: signal peptidase I [Nanoarchaeota archaeon]|nr:signal peptidase I [Nanoarchaeota archaeon]